MLMRAMIVQPMADKTEQEIIETRDKAKALLEDIGYEVMDTYFAIDERLALATGRIHMPIYYLSLSLSVMSKCHAVYFCKGWANARGCVVEHEAALRYGLKTFYEEDAHG